MNLLAAQFIAAWCFSISAFPALAADGAHFNQSEESVSNWRGQAFSHLGLAPEAQDTRGHLRCIRLNNYWCLKDVGWQGSLGHDADRHAAFMDGDMASRAAVRNFRTAYITRGRKSALQIISVYAPSSDCIGSKAATRMDGSCAKGNNDPKKYAELISKGLTNDIEADLRLFDSNGRTNRERMTLFLQNMSAFETGGLRVSAETIKRGICLERADGCDSIDVTPGTRP